MALPPLDWPHRAASHAIRLAPHDWHVQVWGAGSGPDILLLHGAGASAHSWHPLVPYLPGARLIAPDLPGQGFSRTSNRARLGLEAMAQDLAQLCSVQGWQPRAIIAHSAGAAVALRLSHLLPTPPVAVVGINAALGNFEGVEGWLFPLMAKVMAFSPFVGGLTARFVGRAPAVERLIKGTGSSVPASVVQTYARLAGDPSHVEGTLAMMAHWNLDPLLADLPKITVPTLLLATSLDRAVPARISHGAAARLPRGRYLELTALGHLAHEEAPQTLAAPIVQFLAENGVNLGQATTTSA